MPLLAADSSWSVRSRGAPSTADWTDVQEGTAGGGVDIEPDSVGMDFDIVGVTTTFDDRISARVQLIGVDTTGIPTGLTWASFSAFVNSSVEFTDPMRIVVKVCPSPPSAVDDAEWQAVSDLALLPVLASFDFAAAGSYTDARVEFDCDVDEWDAAINRSGTTWLVLYREAMEDGSQPDGSTLVPYKASFFLGGPVIGLGDVPEPVQEHTAAGVGFGAELVFTLGHAPSAAQRVIFCATTQQGDASLVWSSAAGYPAVTIVDQDFTNTGDNPAGVLAYVDGVGDGETREWAMEVSGNADCNGSAWVWAGLDLAETPEQAAAVPVASGDGLETISLAGTPSAPHVTIVVRCADSWTNGYSADVAPDEVYEPSGGTNENRTVMAAYLEDPAADTTVEVDWTDRPRAAVLIAAAFLMVQSGGGPQTLPLDQAAVTMVARDIGWTLGAVGLPLDQAAVTMTARDVTLSAAAQLALDRAQVATVARDLTLTPGPVSLPLSPAAVSAVAQDLTLAATATLDLSPATITAVARDLALAATATLPLDQASIAMVARDLALTAAGTLPLDQAAVLLTARDLALTPGAVGLALAQAAVTMIARDLALTAAGQLALDPAAITAVARDLALQPGAVTLALQPAAVTLVARDLDLLTAGQLPLAPASMLLVARDLALSAGPVTLPLAPAAVAMVARDIDLLAGSGLALQPAAVTLVAQDLTLSATSTLLLQAAAVLLTARDLTLTPGPVGLALSPAGIVLVARDLDLVILGGATVVLVDRTPVVVLVDRTPRVRLRPRL